MDEPLSVMVVDDQAPFRMAARAVIRRSDGFTLAGEAENGVKALELANEIHPDVVLMDINMPEMGGIEATRRIVADLPETFVILCSTYDISDLPPDAKDERRPGLREQGATRRDDASASMGSAQRSRLRDVI